MTMLDTRQESARVAGVILAAGQSRRMGQDKLALPFRGLPLLQHSINLARSVPLEEIVLVCSDPSRQADFDTNGCKVVCLAPAEPAQSASLIAGIKALESDCQGVMVFLGDQPLISVKAAELLLRSFSRQAECWIIPEQDGMRGHPVIIPRHAFDDVLRLTGDTGPRHLSARPGTSLRFIRIHEPGPFIDVDTKADYELLLKRYENLTGSER